MTKKTVGYVNLEWECPACGTRNLGTSKICVNCGAAQPEDVQFEQTAQEKLITDEKLIERAQKGADVHCPYCGARNPADATQCSQCLGDLTDAARRQSGQVLGAHRDKAVSDIICPSCGAANPGTARTCSQCQAPLPRTDAKPAAKAPARALPGTRSSVPRWVIFAVVGAVLLGCGWLMFMTLRTDDMVGEVTDTNWTYTMAIEALLPVEHEAWRDQLPADGTLLSCTQEVRDRVANPVPDSVEVCGTPYTVDTGSGIGEVVQDCEYEVYDDYCTYEVLEWQQADTVSTTGTDFQPSWPAPDLQTDQRPGEQEEAYEVVFSTDGRSYTYHPDTLEEYLQFEPGSRWLLSVNGFNAVTNVEPAR